MEPSVTTITTVTRIVIANAISFGILACSARCNGQATATAKIAQAIGARRSAAACIAAKTRIAVQMANILRIPRSATISDLSDWLLDKWEISTLFVNGRPK